MINNKTLLLILSIIGFSACAKKIVATGSGNSNKHFTVNSAYIQSEVPGNEGGKTQNYLHIKIDFKVDKDNVTFDNVLFSGKILKMEGRNGHFKLNRGRGEISSEQYTLKSNQAIIFYSVNGKIYRHTINNVTSKETIFLP